jgi:hypothetical protein
MKKTQLQKWLSWYSPLFLGRFDLPSVVVGAASAFQALADGLALTRGRFWVRVAGGHDLRRSTTGHPTRADPIVGRADGRATGIDTFPWVGHGAGGRYRYAVTVAGAGGVRDDADAPGTDVDFDAEGEWIGLAPNRVTHPHVEPLSGGRFRVSWAYDERGQAAPPAEFAVYNDAASPGTVDYTAVVATVAYRRYGGFFEFVSGAFEHESRMRWGVRARSAAGVEERNVRIAEGIASSDVPPVVVAFGIDV